MILSTSFTCGVSHREDCSIRQDNRFPQLQRNYPFALIKCRTYSLFFLLLLSEIVVSLSPLKISVQSWKSLWRGFTTKWFTRFRSWLEFSMRSIPLLSICWLLMDASNGTKFLLCINGITCCFTAFSNKLIRGKNNPPSRITLFAKVDSSSLMYRTASSTTSI